MPTRSRAGPGRSGRARSGIPRCSSTSIGAPKVCSSTAGVMTSRGRAGRDHRLVQRHQLRQVGRHAVEVVGGQHDRDALGVELAEQVQHVVPGGDVDAAGRLVHQQQLRLAQQRAGDEHPLLLAAGQLADVPAAELADARAGRAPAPRPRVPSRDGHGRRRPVRAISTHSRDGDREAPVHRLELRHVADASALAGVRPNRAAGARCRAAAGAAMVLPDPDGPTTPTKSVGAHLEVDVGQHRRRRRSRRSRRDPHQYVGRQRAAHWG